MFHFRWDRIFWTHCFVLLLLLLHAGVTFGVITWHYTLNASSRRSIECNYGVENCVCLGTENGRNTISVENGLNHYDRLKKSLINCQRIIGNLEITHIEPEDLTNDFSVKKLDNGTLVRVLNRPFYFLEHIEEITGYLLVFNVHVESITFDKLKIIWGEKKHENCSLCIESSAGLLYLNFPALRSVEEGDVAIKRSPDLCYMDPMRNFVDYAEILGKQHKTRLKVSNEFNRTCSEAPACSLDCDNSCFGPFLNQCQTVYRRSCGSCESNSCYFDGNGMPRCCDEACAGGCIGDGKEKCIACKNFEQDGRCVNDCRGIFRYKPHMLVKEELPADEKRYYYGRHCVKDCPPGTLIEDKYCVARCSEGYHRDLQQNDRVCVPCNGGVCPKVCQMAERIDSTNIRNFVNCTEIEGNLEILSHVFTDHIPDTALEDENARLIPALKAADLEVLKSVRIITGHLVIDGGRKHNINMPLSLEFLENLEMIEGRQLYFEKYSMYIIGNHGLKWLGLKSLKKIKNGMVSVSKNPSLCYSYSIPFTTVLGTKDSIWQSNMAENECENSGRKCDSTCDPATGCWGPGAKMCVRCRNFTRDESCAETCPLVGYFVAADDPFKCVRCHPQCLECNGTRSTDCRSCRNYEWWTRKVGVDADGHSEIAHLSPQHFTFLTAPVRQCVAKCPNSTFVDGKRCEPCHDSCYKFGCTGPNAEYGPGGCNRCKYAIEDEETLKIRCLVGETEQTVCTKSNNVSANYYVGLGRANISKYMCRKCPPECRSCTRESVSVNECECASFKLYPESPMASGSMLLDNHNLSTSTDSGAICVNECGRGSFVLSDSLFFENLGGNAADIPGECQRCSSLCDDRFSCSGPTSLDCHKCAIAGIALNETAFECLSECPTDRPYSYEGFCHDEEKEAAMRRKRNTIIFTAFVAFVLFVFVILYLVYRCMKYRKKYEKEAQMHLPDIPALDPCKVAQRPNMRRLNLIGVDELDDTRKHVLGSGAFGIVYAGKWKPPTRSGISIPVAIKAINPSESRHITEAEMMKEAGMMAAIQHEHLLPLVGICVAKGGIKIVTILRPLGSLLKFLGQHKNKLGSKNLMLYCYQISSAMEFLAKKKIVHRDLAARNVLVKNVNHVEVTDFGLAQMLQGSDKAIVIEGRVAVKWLSIESLRHQVYTERTDVWSFGVTCWEILTFGQSPYRELNLPRDQKLAFELVNHLEKGYRLKQPANCSQELYQEILNCWLVDADSRPSFRQLKEKFETFCRAPHIYIQERQATERMNSITGSDQRLMIERLLQDSDFLDPVNIDPAEYAGSIGSTVDNYGRRHNCLSTSTMETTLPPLSPITANKPLIPSSSLDFDHVRRSSNHSTSTTSSSRYKADPLLLRKYRLSSECESTNSRGLGCGGGDAESMTDDENNYLMPKSGGGAHLLCGTIGKHSIIGESIDEEPANEALFGTLVNPIGNGGVIRNGYVNGVPGDAGGLDNDELNCAEYLPTYLNESAPNNDYVNGEQLEKNTIDSVKENDGALLKPDVITTATTKLSNLSNGTLKSVDERHPTKSQMSYMNITQSETTI